MRTTKSLEKSRALTKLSMLFALQVLMCFTPIGFIQIPPVSITLMHVPVLVGAILLGFKPAMFLGASFGVLSIIRATFAAAGPIDMMFNPFISGSPLASLAMAILPRILLGVVAALLFVWLKHHMTTGKAIIFSAGIASFVHSLLVLSMLSLLFSAFPFMDVFAVIIGFNGLLELVTGVVLCLGICKGVLKAQGK